jgi:hypothetical protein
MSRSFGESDEEVGRLELHFACLSRPWSGGYRSGDLRFYER